MAAGAFLSVFGAQRQRAARTCTSAIRASCSSWSATRCVFFIGPERRATDAGGTRRWETGGDGDGGDTPPFSLACCAFSALIRFDAVAEVAGLEDFLPIAGVAWRTHNERKHRSAFLRDSAQVLEMLIMTLRESSFSRLADLGAAFTSENIH